VYDLDHDLDGANVLGPLFLTNVTAFFHDTWAAFRQADEMSVTSSQGKRGSSYFNSRSGPAYILAGIAR